MRNKGHRESNGSTAMLYAFSMHLTWWARISRVGTHLWWGRIRRHGTRMEWVGRGEFPVPGQFILRVVPWISGDMGRVRIWIICLSLPLSYLQNPSCRDLACVLRPHWPSTQLSCPSTYPSLCLLDIWSFWQWPSSPCNTSVIGPGKFCFENYFSYKNFLLAIQIPSHTWRKRMFP